MKKKPQPRSKSPAKKTSSKSLSKSPSKKSPSKPLPLVEAETLVSPQLSSFAESLGLDLQAPDSRLGMAGFLDGAKRAQRAQLSRRLAGLSGRASQLETLCPQLYARMLFYIRVGAFNSVAAGSIGVSPKTFSAWMKRGQEDFAAEVSTPYARLWLDVYQARSQARLLAEVKVAQDNPLAWLQRGPGRTLPAVVNTETGEEIMEEVPGWTGGGNEAVPSAPVINVLNNFAQTENDTPTQAKMVAALGVLQDLGYVQMTPRGQKLLPTAAIDVPSKDA